MTFIESATDEGRYNKLPYGRVLLPVKVLDAVRDQLHKESMARIKAEEEEFFGKAKDAEKAKEEEAKVQEPAPNPAKAKKTPSKRLIQAFNLKQLEAEYERWKKGTGERKGIRLPFLEAAKANNGLREVPVFSRRLKRLAALREDFPNFVKVIDYLERELTLMSVMPASDFRVSPIVLDGVPGIGKTAFSMRLAEALDLEIDKTNAAGLQSGASILGGSAFYYNTEPSPLFHRLAKGKRATFVFLLDELDKVGGDERFPIVPALLTLLEPETARQLKCENTGIEHDLSKLIVIATSNDKSLIPSPLKSRLRMFDILPPTVEQRKAIVMRMHGDMQKKSRRAIALDHDALEQMAESDCDLRELGRVIRQGFADAVFEGVRVSRPVLLVPQKKRGPGFI